MKCGLQIRAALGALTSRAAKEPAEDVAQVAEVARAEVETTRARPVSSEACGSGTETTNLVVLLALLGVTEDVVGTRDLFELLLGTGIRVGVQLLGQLAIGARDLLGGRARGETQNLV